MLTQKFITPQTKTSNLYPHISIEIYLIYLNTSILIYLLDNQKILKQNLSTLQIT